MADLCVRILHSGIMVVRDGSLVYKGGHLEDDRYFEEESVGRLDLLGAIWELGYQQCGPMYYQDKDSGQYIELANDEDMTEYMRQIGPQEKSTLCVDSPFDDCAEWTRVNENELEAHNDRAHISLIAYMSLREPKVETVGGVGEVEVNATEGGCTIEEEVNATEINDAESESSDTDSEYSAEESSEEEDNVVGDEEPSDADEELFEARKLRTEKKLRRLRRNKKQQEEGIVKLGPVRIDKGLEDYINEGNRNEGLLAGDEDSIGSSDVDSFASEEEDSEENEHRRRKRVTIHYDPNCEEPLWEMGMIFKSVKQFREASNYYAVKRGVNLFYDQNEPKRVRMRCKYVDQEENPCPWHLFGSYDKGSGNFLVKTYHPVHVCEKQTKNSLCNSEFVAKHFRGDIMDNPYMRIWRLQNMFRRRYEVYCGKTVCRRARDKVVREMVGDYTEEFRRLYDYRDLVLQTNPGSTCIIDVEKQGNPERHKFKGMYMCFAAMKEGFKVGCRKLIGFDGCFLKGVFKGMLLSATARNGNNQIFPIAWAVVYVENTETWTWFLDLVSNDLTLRLGEGLSVVTDMQKGLETAIQTVLPRAEHRECARHILSNWAKKWPGIERRHAFYKCAKSTFEKQLKDNLNELKKLGGKPMVEEC